jgi:hypothetical protein
VAAGKCGSAAAEAKGCGAPKDTYVAGMRISRRWQTWIAGLALLASTGLPAAASDGEKVVERQHATLGELPRLVRETLESEAQGGSIGELEKDYHKDKSVTYDAEIVREGKVEYLQVSADGKIIARPKHAQKKLPEHK